MDNATYQRTTELLEAELGNELVALDPDGGSCFGFNEVATIVWRRLDQPKSFGELKDMLLAEFEVGDEQCVEELQALLDDLVEKGLVRVRVDGGRPATKAPGA